MIIGIGVDVVEIERFEGWKGTSMLERFFHPDELLYINKVDINKSKKVFLERVAVRFAAKEAFGKALGTGLKGITLKNICVVNEKNGQPVLKLYGDALQAFIKTGADTIHLSLSHDGGIGTAFAVLEKTK